MKKMWLVFLAIIAVNFIGTAQAAPKFVDAIPSCDANGNVTIPALPGGTELLNVMLYDDVHGVPGKALGPVSNFKLEPGQGFNFVYRDSGGEWFQMITSKSQAPGLATDCSHPGGCKYLYPLR